MTKSRKDIQREYRERNKARIKEIRTLVDPDLLETFVDRGMVGCASLIPDWQHVDLVEVKSAVSKALKEWKSSQP